MEYIKGPFMMGIIYTVYLTIGPIIGLILETKCINWIIKHPKLLIATILQLILFPLYIFFFSSAIAVAGLMPYLFWLWIILTPLTGFSMYNLFLKLFMVENDICVNYLRMLNLYGAFGAGIVSCLSGFILDNDRDITFWKWKLN